MTAEKYEVPYANAVSQGPTERPPSTKLLTLVARQRQYMPIATVMATNMSIIRIFANIRTFLSRYFRKGKRKRPSVIVITEDE